MTQNDGEQKPENYAPLVSAAQRYYLQHGVKTEHSLQQSSRYMKLYFVLFSFIFKRPLFLSSSWKVSECAAECGERDNKKIKFYNGYNLGKNPNVIHAHICLFILCLCLCNIPIIAVYLKILYTVLYSMRFMKEWISCCSQLNPGNSNPGDQGTPQIAGRKIWAWSAQK